MKTLASIAVGLIGAAVVASVIFYAGMQYERHCRSFDWLFR